MKFTKTSLPGAFLIDLTPWEDDRGFFSRVFCEKEFAANGLATRWVQCNLSYNKSKGTVRGLHFQTAPFQENKLIWCNRGSIYDVFVDLRPDSVTYLQWFGAELNSEMRRLLYVPQGFANGFQTLVDNSEVYYHVSEFFNQNFYTGVRWDDPAFGIRLPLEVSCISEKDQSFPLYRPMDKQPQ